jgi:SAM-dependent methyltransferase
MSSQIDWAGWLRRWDEQQTGYLPAREERYTAMLDVVDALLPDTFQAVDLACGPGSLSKRLLERFPQAQCIAVDLDPVLLAVGRGALGNVGGRLRWHEADIMDANWFADFGELQVDAVLTTTALHWLPVERLLYLYRQLGELIRPGGVLLNGDHMSFSPNMPIFGDIAQKVKDHRRKSAFADEGTENWEGWWEALRKTPGLGDLFDERDRRFTWREDAWVDPGYDLQKVALEEAGFKEVGSIWQNMDDRVLLAIR